MITALVLIVACLLVYVLVRALGRDDHEDDRVVPEHPEAPVRLMGERGPAPASALAPAPAPHAVERPEVAASSPLHELEPPPERPREVAPRSAPVPSPAPARAGVERVGRPAPRQPHGHSGPPQEPVDPRPLRAPGAFRTGPARPAADGPPPAGEPAQPPGSSRRDEPIVRGRVGEHQDGWRPPAAAEPPGDDAALDRFSASKYVPPITELRAPGPPDQGAPRPAGPPAGAGAQGQRPAQPGPRSASPPAGGAPGHAQQPAHPGPPPAGARPPGPPAQPPAQPAAGYTAPPQPVTPPVTREPEDEHVDQILRALVRRARDRQVAIADVAVELVEQAELEDRDIDEVLAELVERTSTSHGQDDADVDVESVDEVARAGRLVNLEEMDPVERKRIIVRVLCLLVAFQDSNNLTPASSSDRRAPTPLT